MSYQVELLIAEQTFYATWGPDFQPGQHLASFFDDVVALLSDASDVKTVYLMIDVRDIQFDVDDIMFTAKTFADRRSRYPDLHERIVMDIIVTTNPAIRMSVLGMNNVTFGTMPMRAFETVEEALEYIRVNPLG
jgi:hypothetical protein